MLFTAQEYYLYKGVQHGRYGNLAMLDSILEEGPIFRTPRTMKLFNEYIFGYLVGLGSKGVYVNTELEYYYET